MNFGDKLKELREKAEYTQTDIARLLNISISLYSRYEKEIQLIPTKHLNTICNHFNVSFDYIFKFNRTLNYNKQKIELNKTLSGQRLKEFRKENKLTLAKLGVILNTSYGTLAGYEIGRYIIATPFLYDICKKYHISADYLLGKIDSPKYLK